MLMDVPVDKSGECINQTSITKQLVADIHCETGAHGHGRARRKGEVHQTNLASQQLVTD